MKYTKTKINYLAATNFFLFVNVMRQGLLFDIEVPLLSSMQSETEQEGVNSI